MCRCDASTENARHRRKIEAGQRRVEAARKQYAADVLICAMCRERTPADISGRTSGPRETESRARRDSRAPTVNRQCRSDYPIEAGAASCPVGAPPVNGVHHHPPREAEVRPQAARPIATALEANPDGYVARLRRSKTDQEGSGRQIPIVYGTDPGCCPVRAWVSSASIVEGPLFRPVDRHGTIAPRRLSPQSVALIVKLSHGRNRPPRR